MEAVTTLATIPAVVALVNLVKQFGITGRWASLTAVTLGVVLACAQTYLPSGILTTLTQGLTLGLGAAGLYDLTPPRVSVETEDTADILAPLIDGTATEIEAHK